MKTAKIKGKVKRTADSLQLRGISNQKFRLKTGFPGFLPGKLDGTRGEIYAGNLPASISQGNDVCAGTASDVDGAAGLMILNEVEEFWWADPGVPRRLSEVPVMEKEAAEQVLHVSDKWKTTT